MKNLIIFDVDGTLTNTMDIDTDCFTKAVYEVYPNFVINTDWDSYQNATDTGFLVEIFENNLSRVPTNDEVSKVKTCFVDQLSTLFHKQSVQCTPIKGAVKIFNRMTELGWYVAIATGCWEASALMKLQLADIPHSSIPIAHGDEGIKRQDIIRSAISKASQQYEIKQFNNITYIGDRVWDKVAAAEAKVDFVGIGPVLKNHHGIISISDYDDEHLFSYLNNKISC